MRILGVDPGTLITGFGIIDFNENEISYISSGIIRISAVDDFAFRLKKIHDDLTAVIKKYKPDEFALETAFYGKNVQSALKIGYARGVSLLTAAQNNLNVREYSPREIKKAICGKGSSSKQQIQFMISKICGIKTDNLKYDETDALAVAVCHAFKYKSITSKSKSRNWKEYIEKNPDRVIL